MHVPAGTQFRLMLLVLELAIYSTFFRLKFIVHAVYACQK